MNLEFQSASNCLLGYRHVVLFFLGSIVGFYGAAIFAVWLMAWGASFHRYFKHHLFLAANALLVVLGLWYLVRAHLMA